jgi:hypothetical protein
VGSWITEVVQLPTITDNTIVNGSTVPMLFRYLDESTESRVSAAQVESVLTGLNASNYAYVLDESGNVDTYARSVDFDGNSGTQNGNAQGFYAVNRIGTLNLGQDSTGDAVFGGKRIDMNSGDTIVVKTGPGVVYETIVANGLTVRATAGSDGLMLKLGTELPDGTAVAVSTLTLDDYAAGLGAGVDVDGNGLNNTIIGNSGANHWKVKAARTPWMGPAATTGSTAARATTSSMGVAATTFSTVLSGPTR